MLTYNGIYKATVVDTTDPKKINRVKIRVNGMMNGIPDANLPWAKYSSQTFVKAGSGSWITPAVGALVAVWFAEGNINDPYYMGGILETTDNQPSAVKTGRQILFQSEKEGITIAFNENDGNIEVKTKKYNTTLDEIIEALFGHGHYFTPYPGGVAGPAVLVSAADKAGGGSLVPPVVVALPYTAADFNRGTL